MNLRRYVAFFLVPFSVVFWSALSSNPQLSLFNDLIGAVKEVKAEDTDFQPSDVELDILLHIQDFGDVSFGAGEFAGNRGQSRRVEGFQIAISPPVSGLGIRYMGHIQDVGDTPWVKDGRYIGTRSQGKRLEGFALQLTGSQAKNYRIFYKCHIQNIGDSPVLSNGQFCGTRGKQLRLEAMQVWIKRL